MNQPTTLQQPDERTDAVLPAEPWRVSAWLVSLIVHLVLLILISMVSVATITTRPLMTLISPPEPVPLEPEIAQQFAVTAEATDRLGAASVDGTAMALSSSSAVSELTVMPPTELEESEFGAIEFAAELIDPTDRHEDQEVIVRGLAGEGVTGAEGAIDRIAHEILLSIEERPTLVVWLFDQSLSLATQREHVIARFDRIYEQLGVLESKGNAAFRKHSEPLLTSVWSFGQRVQQRLAKPTADLTEIKEAVRGIEPDTSGNEQVFSAVYAAVNRFKGMRSRGGSTDGPQRNVMVVIFSDEAGDDQQGLDQTVALCRKLAVPVYVVGVPAPFGVQNSVIKWVDPDPKFDQTAVQWPAVHQGPESMFPERVVLPFTGSSEFRVAGSDEMPEPLDSGFGPFALTRLCASTGGIYFTVHPNRTGTRYVSQGDVANYTSYLRVFFEAEVMRRYRPDYVTGKEYERLLKANPIRQALVQAAQISQIERLDDPMLVFVKADDASLVAALTEAQKDAAKLQPQIDAVFDVLSQAEPQREKELAPRWQAGYDLALGTVAAVKVRTESYNAMLAQAKRGMEFQQAENNTWVLKPDAQITVGSRLSTLGDKSREYLERVVKEHPGTPWAYLAQRELKEPMGWRWDERFTNLAPPANDPGNNNPPPPPQDEVRRMLERKPTRPAPKL
ncbi:MAG: vWA domain-containing protein [Pirellulales bacterium]